jgi:uncharacterized membrane protein YgcG
MFEYNGGQNRAGEIMADGYGRAAAINASAMANLGDDVQAGLGMIVNRYAQGKAMEGAVKGYDEALKIAAPSLQLDGETVDRILKMPAHDRMGVYQSEIFGGMLRGQQAYNNSYMAATGQMAARGGAGGGASGGGGGSGGGSGGSGGGGVFTVQ